MPSADTIRETLRNYVDRLSAGDADAVAAMYSEDGSIEDPVGMPGHQGRDAVRGFYAMMAGALTAEICGPICVAGQAGVMPLLARLDFPGQPVRWIDAIDVVEFDESGAITSLRAYWNSDDMRDARDPA
jgi:steroid delta-isomerase